MCPVQVTIDHDGSRLIIINPDAGHGRQGHSGTGSLFCPVLTRSGGGDMEMFALFFCPGRENHTYPAARSELRQIMRFQAETLTGGGRYQLTGALPGSV